VIRLEAIVARLEAELAKAEREIDRLNGELRKMQEAMKQMAPSGKRSSIVQQSDQGEAKDEINLTEQLKEDLAKARREIERLEKELKKLVPAVMQRNVKVQKCDSPEACEERKLAVWKGGAIMAGMTDAQVEAMWNENPHLHD